MINSEDLIKLADGAEKIKEMYEKNLAIELKTVAKLLKLYETVIGKLPSKNPYVSDIEKVFHTLYSLSARKISKEQKDEAFRLYTEYTEIHAEIVGMNRVLDALGISIAL